MIQLKDDTQAANLTEVIRRAVAVYEHLLQAKARGNQVCLIGEDGNREIELIP